MDTKRHIRELLPVYLDQMCSEEEKKVVEAHLLGCVACRQELEDLRKTVTLVAGLKEIEPPGNMWEGITQRIQKKSFWEIFVWPRFSGVAVATVTILFLAVTVNKYSTRIAEQAKTGTKSNVTAGSNVPPAPPLLSPKPFALSMEKKIADKTKAEARPVPAVDTLRYNEEIAGKKDESDYSSFPREVSGLVSVSQQKGKLLDKNTHSPSSYVIEMEVEDMDESMQRLEELAQNYQAQRVSQSGDNGDLFYQIHQQKLDGFVRDLNKVGRVSHREAEYERLKVSPACGDLGTGASSQPKLIQIKFNPSK